MKYSLIKSEFLITKNIECILSLFEHLFTSQVNFLTIEIYVIEMNKMFSFLVIFLPYLIPASICMDASFLEKLKKQSLNPFIHNVVK